MYYNAWTFARSGFTGRINLGHVRTCEDDTGAIRGCLEQYILMREFQEKQKIRKRIYSKTTLLVLFIVMLFIAKGVWSIYGKERASHREVERLESQQKELQQRLDTVSANNEKLKTREGVEAEIRAKFDVVKADEGVIVVVDQELPMPEEEKKGFMKRFWDSVTGVFKKDSPESSR